MSRFSSPSHSVSGREEFLLFFCYHLVHFWPAILWRPFVIRGVKSALLTDVCRSDVCRNVSLVSLIAFVPSLNLCWSRKPPGVAPLPLFRTSVQVDPP